MTYRSVLTEGEQQATLAIHGDLTTATAGRFSADLTCLTERAPTRHLVVDLCQVNVVEPTVLGFLLSAQRRARETDSSLIIEVEEGTLWQALRVTGLSHLLPVTERSSAASGSQR